MIEITYLSEHLGMEEPSVEELSAEELAEMRKVARWHQEEWAHLSPKKSVASRVRELRESAVTEGLPLTLVAVEEEAIVGTISLAEEDLETYPECGPWLSTVYVDESVRRRGIGSRLVRRVEKVAADQGVEELYLYTPDQAPLYERLGWEVVAVETYRGEEVTVMRRDLAEIVEDSERVGGADKLEPLAAQ
ncbi:GNAT family N-acetyltransferase [Lujinxingia litoralis]|uniref:GNAT family N-acetyltransferase n=1 Tax=Lujinxingia litoralis TaxID=2211119 RepID=A0A328C4S1_9DELT|nr:GNAT family N-acetyltransferase [Lujinxingia litoralis]RAL20751.1 GNAT family N-acetyltransferase [Lujinxingia litoralis]